MAVDNETVRGVFQETKEFVLCFWGSPGPRDEDDKVLFRRRAEVGFKTVRGHIRTVGQSCICN